jgi:3D (Asp-Asp-Asp) domain-containing protein
MALHLCGKVTVIVLVIAALITAFSASSDVPPNGEPLDLTVSATVLIASAPTVALELRPHLELLAEPLAWAYEPPAIKGPVATPSLEVRATAYNSLESQTNSQPFVTATGAQTRWGIIAVSRDLLEFDLPYGSLVRLRDLGNFHNGRGYAAYQTLLDGAGLFVVEDTMHPRKTNQIDVWFADYASAVNWGVRRVELDVIRYGREGPLLDHLWADGPFELEPRWLAAR